MVIFHGRRGIQRWVARERQRLIFIYSLLTNPEEIDRFSKVAFSFTVTFARAKRWAPDSPDSPLP